MVKLRVKLLIGALCGAVLVPVTAQASSVTGSDRPTNKSTWDRDSFPEFRIEMADDDLDHLLHNPTSKDNPDLSKYPIKLHYRVNDQDSVVKGTIRLRGGNASRCGDKRQFRIDFDKKTTLPDGYRTDRFETDHGICNTLNEWMAWQTLGDAAALHPEINLLRKNSNVVAIYFNDKLYHVQSLLEDVSKDVLERNLGTRNTVQFKGGCYSLDREKPSEITPLCQASNAAEIEKLLDVPSFLYASATTQVLGSADMFPAYPWNMYFIYNQDTGRTHFLAHDFDMSIDYVNGAQHDPFTVVYDEQHSSAHLPILLREPKWNEMYRGFVEELTALISPQHFVPVVSAKYEQIRDTLLASPDLPHGADYYDTQYRTNMPKWSAERFDYLQGVRENPPRPRLSFFGELLGVWGEAYAVAAVDLTHDDDLDLAIVNRSQGEVSIFTGQAASDFWWGIDLHTINVGGAPVAIAPLDADGDGWTDLAIADTTASTVTLWRNLTDGNYQKIATLDVPHALSVHALKSARGGWTLVAVSDGENADGNLYRARIAGGSIEPMAPLSVGVWAQPPAFGDFDRDGAIDAVVANLNVNQLTVVSGVESADARTTAVPTSAPVSTVAVADFDRDGFDDVAALASDANQLVRVRNVDGASFVVDNVVDLPTGFWRGDWASMAAADFDGDEFADVAITDYRDGIIRVYRGSKDGFANSRNEFIGTGNKGYGTIAPDMNEDGRADIIAVAGTQGWVNLHINRGGVR